MEAASAASAAPALKISTKCSGDLAPPEAMTGTDTALEISAVSFVSKPSCVPSRSTEVSRISPAPRSEEHTSELQSLTNLVCRLLLEKKKQHKTQVTNHNI